MIGFVHKICDGLVIVTLIVSELILSIFDHR